MQIHRLTESIQHVEDLPVDEFIGVIKNITNLQAQEKLDGANLWMGIDDQGKFFTSREGKRHGSERRYGQTDWPKVSTNNQFRAAHAALEKVQDQIKQILKPGDMVEVEVLFGAQPNAISYGSGKSLIAFLRGVLNTPDEKASQLATKLHNQLIEVQVEVVESSDGSELQSNTQNIKFQFTSPQKIDSAKLDTQAVQSGLNKLEKFLLSASGVEGLTNSELATLSLNSVPKEKRFAAKQARDEVLAKIKTDFKEPIKAAILTVASKELRADLQDTKSAEGGIEGIVLRDPETGKQFKVVDKDVFSAINKFNQSVRAEIQGPLNTVDPDASLDARGGLVGELRIDIADFLGNPEMAKPSFVRKILEPIKGNSPEDAIRNFAKTLPSANDVEGAKKKITALIKVAQQKLADKLQNFKDNRGEYKLTLKNGKEVSLSDDTVKKTLATFAEAKRNMNLLADKINDSKNMAQLLAVLYGQSAKAVHQAKLEEELILERKGEIDVREYDDKSLFELLNTYFAMVFMTMVIYHTGDTLGMRKLRDRRNYMMRKHAADMSPLNHWGYPVWRHNKPELKERLDKKVILALKDITQHIRTPDWKNMHMQFSYDNELEVQWKHHKKLLRKMMDLSGVRSDRLNSLLDIAVGFNELSHENQVQGLKDLIAYVRRFAPRSSLFVRIRAIAKDLMKEKIVTESLLKSIALAEDEGGGGGEATASVNGGVSAGAIASVPVKIGFGRRNTEMRRRNPEVNDLMKKFKDPRKENK
jgi:hypothetical protein